MGVIEVLMLALKQILRNYGLKVCLIATFMLTVLIKVAGNKVPSPVLIGVVLPASASSLIIDFKTHYSMLRVLYMIGATPRQIKTYLSTPSVIFSAIYGMPYVAMGVACTVLVFLLSLVSSIVIMMFTLRATKKGSLIFMM